VRDTTIPNVSEESIQKAVKDLPGAKAYADELTARGEGRENLPIHYDLRGIQHALHKELDDQLSADVNVISEAPAGKAGIRTTGEELAENEYIAELKAKNDIANDQAKVARPLNTVASLTSANSNNKSQ